MKCFSFGCTTFVSLQVLSLIVEILGLVSKDNERRNQENDQEPQKMLSSSKCDKDPNFAFFCK